MATVSGNLLGLGNTVPSYAGAASDLFSGAGSFVGGLAAAGSSKASATEYGYAQTFTKEQKALQDALVSRQIYQTASAAKAGEAANGFQLGGSAGDILRDIARQGALTKGAISLQAAAQEQAYLEQQKAAKQAATGGLLGGILGGAADVAAALL